MFRWYAVNTYSGHENKVKQNLEHRRISLGQENNIRQIVIPTEQVQEMKDGQKQTKEQRTMPGYLLVNMNLTDDSWQLVKNTPGRDRLRGRVATTRCRSTRPRSTACSTARPPSARARARSSRSASP